jgi:Tol biopolymer transport system component
MLTGARAFNGDTSRDVIVSVVAREPDLSRLPSDLHPDVRVLIRRCLEKSVRHRWQAIGDVRIEIERILAAHPTGLKTGDDSAKAPEWWRTAAIVATIVAITAVATLVTWRMRATRSEVTRPVRRFSIPLEMVRPVVSPDGQHIAYRSQDRLWIRDLSSDVSREIPGGEARGGYYNDTGYYLTWSPDNQSLAFLAENEIRRASVVGSGSATVTICTLPASSTPNKRVGGMAWSHDGGSIVFSRYGAGIYEVPARGGVPIRLSDVQHADDLVIVDTPRGRALLYAVLGPRGHDLMVRTPAGESRKVTELESSWPELVYVPTGHILFRKLPVENPSLWALPFSVTTLRALGEPFMVERSGLGASLADDGTLVYLDNISRGQQVLAWRDRDGKILGKASEGHAVIRAARLSPDGSRAIATTVEPTQTGLWIYDVQRFARTRLMTEDRSTGQIILFGFWAKRNNDVYYAIGTPLDQESNIFTRTVDGPDKPRQLPFSKGFMVAQDATADGRYVVATRSVAGANANQIYYWHNDGQAKSQAVDFSRNAEQEQAMVLSPNGRFIAYTSTVGDRLEVYVRPFPEGAGRWQISTRGGVGPRWHTDGSALFFVENNSLMRVGVSTTGSFSAAATATPLFESPLLRGDPGPFARYDVSPDGRRFLTVEYERDIAQPLVRVAENWLSDFRARQSR